MLNTLIVVRLDAGDRIVTALDRIGVPILSSSGYLRCEEVDIYLPT